MTRQRRTSRALRAALVLRLATLADRRCLRSRSHRSGRRRHRAARFCLRRHRRTVPLPRRAPPHFRRRDCRRHCRRFRRPARHRASHRCPRSRRHRPPLNRRGSSDPPGSPASISPSLIHRKSDSDPPGRASVWHTRRTESAGGACALLRRPAGATFASRRLWAPPCCWIERVSHRYTRLVMTGAASGVACVHRYTDRHTVSGGRTPYFRPFGLCGFCFRHGEEP